MNDAMSIRLILWLPSIGSPTCLLHTGMPKLSPSSSLPPLTAVHKLSLEKILRQASRSSPESNMRRAFAKAPIILRTA